MALEGEFSRRWQRLPPVIPLSARASAQVHAGMGGEDHRPSALQPIRRLANEFGTEARIGSTIVIDGVTLPYRPVAAIAFRGSQGHMNSLYNFFAVDLLNHLVGAADVVGRASASIRPATAIPRPAGCATSRAPGRTA